jgi:alpha-beta hydrolase superfamily lysophospholipase
MLRRTRWLAWKAGKLLALVAVTIGVTLLAARAYTSLQGPPLRPWHTFTPDELSARALDGADWGDYLAHEDEIFADVEANVTQKLESEDEYPANRYFDGSPLYPARFPTNWNHSFILDPEGEPKGAVVLLHGLTDSPYSLRDIADLYRQRGFVAVALRVPGHGTVPGGLTQIVWEDWLAATRLAVRTAVARAGAGKPLHVVGYSNGGALALKYALDTLYDPELAAPTQIVLLSPMIGVTTFARFAGLAALPSYFPAFVKTSWLDVLPEYNPFKYNSFPVNAARQSYRLTAALQTEVEEAVSSGDIKRLPPVLTFMSAVDHTVDAHAAVSRVYDKLPRNGSELVLFDLNRIVNFDLLIRNRADAALGSLTGTPPRNYRLSVVSNAGQAGGAVYEAVTNAGSTEETMRPLGLSYPVDVFSLSHIALPFPPDDPLYGGAPDPSRRNEFGINLGSLALRGEIGVLAVSSDTLLRISYNPFFPYLVERVSGTIGVQGDEAAEATAAP